MSDHCVHSHRTYYLLHFNYRAASRTVIFEMGPSIKENRNENVVFIVFKFKRSMYSSGLGWLRALHRQRIFQIVRINFALG